jgi:hypothetical protein
MSSDVVGELERVCALFSTGRLMSHVLPPCGEGVHLPFIGQGEGELQACRTIQLHEEVWLAPSRSWRPPWGSLPRSRHHGVPCTRTVAASRVGA